MRLNFSWQRRFYLLPLAHFLLFIFERNRLRAGQNTKVIRVDFERLEIDIMAQEKRKCDARGGGWRETRIQQKNATHQDEWKQTAVWSIFIHPTVGIFIFSTKAASVSFSLRPIWRDFFSITSLRATAPSRCRLQRNEIEWKLWMKSAHSMSGSTSIEKNTEK